MKLFNSTAVSLLSLGSNLQDASELAVLLEEAGGLSVDNSQEVRRLVHTSSISRCSTPRTARAPNTMDRIRAAAPIDVRSVDWSALALTIPTEALTTPVNSEALQIDLNSGGRVYFCLFRTSPHAPVKPSRPGIFSSIGAVLGIMPQPPAPSPPPPVPRPRGSSGGGGMPPAPAPGTDRICVLKFCQSRLLAMAEQLATEIARHAGVAAPESRIVHLAGPTAVEWSAMEAAAEALGSAGEELRADMASVPAALLMSYIQGSKLSSAGDVFQGPGRAQLFEDLGRIFVVDCVLGNADRLPCTDLGWRGNPGNVMVGLPGSKHAGRLVAIDACVQRRPPAAKMEREDDAVDRLAQLVLTDPGNGGPGGAVVLPLLRDQLLVGASQSATRALKEHPGECVAAFQRGMRGGLTRVTALKGLFEMMHGHLTEWVAEFLADMKAAAPHIQLPSPTKAKTASPPSGPPPAAGARHPARRTSLPGDLELAKDGRGARRGALMGPAVSSSQPGPRPATHAGSGAAASPPRQSAPGHYASSTPPQPGAAPRAPTTAWGAKPGEGPTSSSAPPKTGQPPGVGVTPPPAVRGQPPPLRTPFSAPSALAGVMRDRLVAGQRDLSLTMALKAVGAEARRDSVLSARVENWRSKFRQHAAKLKTAADEWQARHGVERVLTMGFLSGAAPIVDLYELKVRLDHMLRRLRVLTEAATAAAPVHLVSLSDNPYASAGPQLYLGGAVAADSHHVLRHLGITHILNATEEVAPPPPAAGFTVCRVPLRDTDDEDIARHFSTAADFIDRVARGGVAGGGAVRGSVLVHCSEGRSRSVALVVAYLVARRRMTLANALTLVRSRRPEAAPNAGFSAALVALERTELGSSSVEGPAAAHNPAALAAQNVLGAKKARPEALRCPVCDAAVGLSKESLAVHLRTKHSGHTESSAPPTAAVRGSSKDGTPVRGILPATTATVCAAGLRAAGSAASAPKPAARPAQVSAAVLPAQQPTGAAAAGSRPVVSTPPKPERPPGWFAGAAPVASPSAKPAVHTPTKSSPPTKAALSPTKQSAAPAAPPSASTRAAAAAVPAPVKLAHSPAKASTAPPAAPAKPPAPASKAAPAETRGAAAPNPRLSKSPSKGLAAGVSAAQRGPAAHTRDGATPNLGSRVVAGLGGGKVAAQGAARWGWTEEPVMGSGYLGEQG